MTRDELHEAVWSEPLSKLAERYGVSDSYLARVCDSLRVPRPKGGYWAKLAVGKAPPRTALPAAELGDPTEWSTGNGVMIRSSGPRTTPPHNSAKKAASKTHPLIDGAMADFLRTREIKEYEYLRPFKKNLVDIASTPDGLKQALAFANKLFLALETRGHRVQVLGGSPGPIRRPDIDMLAEHSRGRNYRPLLSKWVPARITATHISGQIIGLAIVELAVPTLMRYVRGSYVADALYQSGKRKHADDSSWTTTMNVPSGRLRLVAYCPHYRVDLARQWQVGDTNSLTEEIPSILEALEAMGTELVELVEQANRDLADEHRKHRLQLRQNEIERNKNAITNSVARSREGLEDIISSWSEARAKSAFLDGVEQHILEVPEPDRPLLLSRLSLARDLLGSLDPLEYFRTWRSPTEIYEPKVFDKPDID